MAHIPSTMPEGLVAYARSPDFCPENLPAKLKSAHTTKAGAWGLLHVLSGSVRFTLENPDGTELIVPAGAAVVIEPEIEHRVEFVEPGRFYIEFWKMP